MSLAEVLLSAMWMGLTLYALLAGADFGGGVWDLLAGGGDRGQRRRQLVEHTIGPVWEANHVWLIFVLVILWTGFPDAFAPLMATLIVPLTAAAIGIILRGSGFAFRKSVSGFRHRQLFGATFALSSLLTPFFLGTVAGAVASGRVPPEARAGDLISSWVTPTSLLGGTLAVLTCAYLAAVFLCLDARRRDQPDLVEWFRTAALASGGLTGAAALVGIGVLATDAEVIYDGLTGDGAALVVLSAVGGAGSIVLLARRRFLQARLAAAGAVTAIIWGWAVAQHPYLLVDHLTIEEGAGSHATLVAMTVSLGIGAAIIAPSLVYLLWLAQRDRLG